MNKLKTSCPEVIAEAKRYLDNARDILKTKAGRENGYYKDAKYIRMACATAYNAVLFAVDEYLERRGKAIIKKKHQRKNVDDYKKVLAALNRKLLNHFDGAYHILHLDGYYDGVCDGKLIDLGIQRANEIITGIEHDKF